MFKWGGNAVDAAVAAAFTSFVSEALVINIGAGGFALVVDGKEPDKALSYDFFSAMPSHGGDRDFRQILLDFGGDKQPFYIGRASTAVPGALAGLRRMAESRARLPLKKLMEPAIDLAFKGFELTPEKAYLLELLEGIYTDTPQLGAIFAPNGAILRENDHVNFPKLGETLKRIAEEGSGIFYEGSIAQAIVQDHQQNGGLITARDLAQYQVHEHKPMRVSYRDLEVLLTPPASHGGALLGFALKLLETVSLKGLAPNSFQYLNIMAHVSRLTNIVRGVWNGGHEDEAVRISWLLDESRIRHYSDLLHQALAGKPFEDDDKARIGGGNTTHISALDSEGLSVSMTYSSGECGGYLVGDTGMCLNNMLGELDLNPHGFHKDAPGNRLMSMMCPVTILKNGQPILALGSAGSNRIRSAMLQVMGLYLDLELPLDQAINAPRFHYEEGVLQLEGGMEPHVASKLEQAGFRVNLWREKNLFFGGAQAVGYGTEGLTAGADRRRGGRVARG